MKKLVLRLITILFARPSFYRQARRLHHLSLRLMGVLNSEDFRVSGERRALRRSLQGVDAPVVIDVGANEGHYATAVLELSPSAQVYAFEPHPHTYRRLKKVSELKNFHAYNLGCAAVPGRLPLYDYAEGEGSTHASLAQSAIERNWGKPSKAIEVNLVRLDDFCEENKITRIRLLKIDTEGFEFSVLQGAQRLVANAMIDVIQFEFNEMNVYSGVFMREFFDFLKGYNLFRLLPTDFLPLQQYNPCEHELFAFQNILAIRNGVII